MAAFCYQMANGRQALNIYPVHIVLAYTSQMVLDLKDGFKLIKNKYGTRLPSMISNVTGPSRTADIERPLYLARTVQRAFRVFTGRL